MQLLADGLQSIATAITNAFAKGNGFTSTVAAVESTTSTSYVALTTAQAITTTVGASGVLLVVITSHSYNSGANDTFHSYALSGANTLAASDNYSKITSFTTGSRASAVFLHTGLTPGSTTVTVQCRVTAGTGSFQNRQLSVIPF